MNTIDVISVLDKALPDGKIVEDVHAFIRGFSTDNVLEIQFKTTTIRIPVDAVVEIVMKVFRKPYHNGVGFAHYTVTVAIGGFYSKSTGFHRAGHCFADLFYDENGDLVTRDFYIDFTRLSDE